MSRVDCAVRFCGNPGLMQILLSAQRTMPRMCCTRTVALCQSRGMLLLSTPNDRCHWGSTGVYATGRKHVPQHESQRTCKLGGFHELGLRE